MMKSRSCELCNGEAALYCDADAAFLCWGCDRRVHSANFLVARHLRRLACSACRSFAESDDGDPALVVSGPGSGPIRSLCRSCEPDPVLPLSPSTSAVSSCVSRADSDEIPHRTPPAAVARRKASPAKRVMEGWGKSMGLRRWRRCAGVAARVMGACVGGMTALPLRAAMAAAMWFAVKICDRACGETLRKLQNCSGVPAKVIVSHEARIALAAARRRREAAPIVEGAGECS